MIGSFGPIHWLLLAGITALLFGGRGRISGLMEDAAKGIKNLRKGLTDDD